MQVKEEVINGQRTDVLTAIGCGLAGGGLSSIVVALILALAGVPPVITLVMGITGGVFIVLGAVLAMLAPRL